MSLKRKLVALTLPFVALTSNAADIPDGTTAVNLSTMTVIVKNPNGKSALYVNGNKVGDFRKFKFDKSFSAKTAEANPTFDPFEPSKPWEPKPKPCGDMDCPKPNDPKPPKPDDCHGPFCPGGMPFLMKNQNLYIYSNKYNTKFPTILPTDVSIGNIDSKK
ncbi:hypothetical protein J2S30_001987 [Herbaspirillum rubrisubalbicans]|uniref:hypothetical protein n=1 Tax=Herbaspirillum rubrisubalbicans TaxID=80842 RepID=UPI0020A10D6D|nr:hypothetical protein [Herbaspirillum rubrisubalbicans]MCP1573608.1 hypothetical protein [Herbaspirillum rubrisubalbicans]